MICTPLGEKYVLHCDPAGLLQESLGPFGPEVSPECPRECPRKRGVSERVSDWVFPGPEGPRAPECPKSVPRVSKRCPGHSRDTLGTLFGHPVGHSLGHPPVFRDTLGDTPGDTSGPKGPRDSCSRPAGSQVLPFFGVFWSAAKSSFCAPGLSTDQCEHPFCVILWRLLL